MDDGIKARVNHDFEMMMEGIREYKAEHLELDRKSVV